MAHDLYPLKFEPIYKEKVWGGRALERLGRILPRANPAAKGASGTLASTDELAGPPIGESWEVADLHGTSASGGGGGAERSVIANGHLAGKTLQDAISHYGEKLLGRLRL